MIMEIHHSFIYIKSFQTPKKASSSSSPPGFLFPVCSQKDLGERVRAVQGRRKEGWEREE
jgi:hypothetical protein